jgi:hypothetical protein
MDINNLTNLIFTRLVRNENRTRTNSSTVLSLTNKIDNIDMNNDNLLNKYLELKNYIKKINDKIKNYEWRTYDGSSNNIFNPKWGSSNINLIRISPSNYKDGVSSLSERGPNNPNPRVISNSICKASEIIKNKNNLSDMIWVWGQFLDHELDFTPTNSEEAENIITKKKEEDKNEEFPERTIKFNRSKHIQNISPREQPNIITSYTDASNVYGSTTERSFYLRRLDGSGKIKTSLSKNNEELMHYNTNKIMNSALPGIKPEELFLAGDIRSNENVLLSALHTLFVREHNRLCDLIINNDVSLVGKEELIYQKARKILGGIMQKITYDEFLPSLLGSKMFSSYSGYNKNIDTSIATEFSTVGFRLGHSMLSSKIQIGSNPEDTLELKDLFFKPEYLYDNGIDDLLLGATKTLMKKIDNQIIDDVRNFLFGSPTELNLLDLAALNIQRGRDHGIPGYNTVRERYGLLKKNTFSEITSNKELQEKLETLYGSPNYIDPWIGALCEDHVADSAVGELISAILIEQFRRVRDGDRFWYENDKSLGTFELNIINNSKLSDVIIRNTNISSLQKNVFKII